MSIYPISKSCGDAAKRYLQKKNLEFQVESHNIEKISLLDIKKVFLIDVYDTFIEPYDEWDRPEVNPPETRPIRQGFTEFIQHYHDQEKIIGVHSDAFNQYEFAELKKVWPFGKNIDKLFDDRYIKRTGFGTVKLFEQMIDELGVEKKDVLIIGDGASDILGTVRSNLDLLMVPGYWMNKEFSYHSLIKQEVFDSDLF